ncbi:MAG: homocysteine S-methyltransferase family protein [Clostridia bacterium]|nr:homocysteine S-methyltransferase family protein [Clostridia bacterium]
MTDRIIFLDGAMGTMLQAAGLKAGARPELLCLEKPDLIQEIHTKYINAGSNIIYTNTFGANRHKLSEVGTSPLEIIPAAVNIAKKAAGNKAKVALDVGPIGELLEPLGSLSFDNAYDIFKEMVIIGEKSGADLVVFETMTDLSEVRAAVLAAKENTKLPIFVTMSFEKNGRTFAGTTAAAMAITLTGLGVDALGINCSLGPDEIFPIAEDLVKWTSLPIIIKANAGLPDPATNKYSINAEAFASTIEKYLALGVTIFGGCCGTTPDYIKALKAKLHNKTPLKTCKKPIFHGICSAGRVENLSKGIHVIGERINPTGKKRFQQAIKENDMNYVMQRAIEQAEAGADILDVNVGVPGIDEPAMMRTVIKALQSVVNLPLQIDSTNPIAIEAGLRAYTGKAIVNSINAKKETMEQILPLVKKYGASVVGLTMDETGLPTSYEQRIEMAQLILDTALSYGIPKEDVYIDCLTLTVSAQQDQAPQTLKAMEFVRNQMGLHCVLGVSNISFGLPQRERVTESFLTQALYAGLDLPIINPNSQRVMDCISCFKVLSGEDNNCSKYIERFSQEVPTDTQPSSEQMTIERAVIKGLKDETARLAEELLLQHSELTIINELLIPALDKVGEQYEKGIIFLPQLINSANAASAAFDVIKAKLAQDSTNKVSKGKIVIATVHGDIHDIGKNIVKVVLENYGYQVIDLGKDVPPETIVETVLKEDIELVGLSALMTTTVPAMSKTISMLRNAKCNCKIMVGGAVLTPEFAKEIGADFYAKDAKQSADIAKSILG